MAVKIKVRVIPRSSHSEVVGEMGDGTIKVKLTAPPVDGKANEALIELLAEHYDIAKTKIKIISGLASKNKTIEID
ncbi:MAG: DUF167 domain-containing protein [Patescibacteria group bacterium]